MSMSMLMFRLMLKIGHILEIGLETEVCFIGNEGSFTRQKYSSPHLVEDWMEELIVGLLLVENEWPQM